MSKYYTVEVHASRHNSQQPGYFQWKICRDPATGVVVADRGRPRIADEDFTILERLVVAQNAEFAISKFEEWKKRGFPESFLTHNVFRYDCELDDRGGDNQYAIMVEHPTGEYVTFDEYMELYRELEAHRNESR